MTKMRLFTLIAATLMLTPASILIAGSHGHDMFTTDIGEMDTNSDQMVSFEEFKNFQIKDMQAAFNMLDTNNDEMIDQNEWDDFIRVHSGGKTM